MPCEDRKDKKYNHLGGSKRVSAKPVSVRERGREREEIS